MTWPMRRLSELCLLAVDCVNKTAPVVDYETPYKMIRTTNVKNGFIDLENVRYVTEETFLKWTRRSRLRRGDVVLSREAPVGEVGRFTSDDENVFLGQRLFHYRPDPEQLDWNYLAFALQSHDVQGRLRGMGFGATVDHIRVPDAENLLIPAPPIGLQRRIGAVLAAYDDLIAINRRRIQLLEESARLIFREWFVHLRFPEHQHVRIAGGIPDGWTREKLGDLASFVMGQSPNSKYYNTDGIGLPFHQGVSDFGSRFPTNTTYCTVEARIAEPGDILFSVRAPVGRINIALDKIVIGRGLAAIRSKRQQQSLLFYDLKNVELLTPPSRLADLFQEAVRPIDRQITVLHRSNAALKTARDLLLPRLVSGELAA